MACEWTERVSLLLDGVLSNGEAAEVEGHLGGCAECRAAQGTFLEVRAALRGHQMPLEPSAQLAALTQVLAARRVPWWRRPIPLPAPALAGLVALLVALGVAAARGPREPPPASAYDRGERMAIYVVKRGGR